MATRIELKESGVIFKENAHEYWLDGKQLSGITEVLRKMLYPDLYTGIPEHIIKKAGEYGSRVHNHIELFDRDFYNTGAEEVQDYIRLTKENNLVHEASEYLVTDGVNWASKIDKVYRVSDDTVSIADIKTYATLTPEKLELAKFQLSTYAWMLQLMTPKLKIDKLYIIQLRYKTTASGKLEHIAKIVTVNRVPSFICEELLNCYLTGQPFINPYSVPIELRTIEGRIRELIATKQAAEEELNEIKADILSTMEKMDVKTWLTEGGMRLTRKLPSTRTSFDLTLFKKAHPEYNYEDYFKISNVSGSLQIAI